MQKLLAILILGFSLSTNNAVEDDKSICHEGFDFASGENRYWKVQFACEKCFKAIFSEPCNIGLAVRNVTNLDVNVTVGCLRDGRTCNDVATAYSIYPGCKVTECGECQKDLCNNNRLKTSTNFATTENGRKWQCDLSNGAGAMQFATPLGIMLALGILTIHLLLPLPIS